MEDLEIRKAVAVEVVGWKQRWVVESYVGLHFDSGAITTHKQFYDEKEARKFFDCQDQVAPYPRMHTEGPPAYESDIAAAWLVVEKMRADGFGFELDYGPTDASVCYATFTHMALRVFAHERLKPAPLAICKAALAAVRATKQSGVDKSKK